MSGASQYDKDECFRSFQGGHERGFSVLFSEWYTSVCYFASSFLNDTQEAEDVTAECFIKLWERRNEFSSLQACKSFLYSIVRNACIDIVRHRRVIQSSEKEMRYLQMENRTLLDQIIISELAGQVQDAMDSLPPQCRKIFHLLFREGKNNPEVAAALKISIHTVRAQKQRGLMLLRKKLLTLFWVIAVFL